MKRCLLKTQEVSQMVIVAFKAQAPGWARALRASGCVRGAVFRPGGAVAHLPVAGLALARAGAPVCVCVCVCVCVLNNAGLPVCRTASGQPKYLLTHPSESQRPSDEYDQLNMFFFSRYKHWSLLSIDYNSSIKLLSIFFATNNCQQRTAQRN